MPHTAEELALMHIRASGPVSLRSVADFLERQCEGVTESNRYRAARATVKALLAAGKIEQSLPTEDDDEELVYDAVY